MRPVLNEEERRRMPCTSYPFDKRNSARKEPSWPVIPVIKAFFIMLSDLYYAFRFYLWRRQTIGTKVEFFSDIRDVGISHIPFFCFIFAAISFYINFRAMKT